VETVLHLRAHYDPQGRSNNPRLLQSITFDAAPIRTHYSDDKTMTREHHSYSLCLSRNNCILPVPMLELPSMIEWLICIFEQVSSFKSAVCYLLYNTTPSTIQLLSPYTCLYSLLEFLLTRLDRQHQEADTSSCTGRHIHYKRALLQHHIVMQCVFPLLYIVSRCRPKLVSLHHVRNHEAHLHQCQILTHTRRWAVRKRDEGRRIVRRDAQSPRGLGGRLFCFCFRVYHPPLRKEGIWHGEISGVSVDAVGM
jgi:hypothetical protein